MEYLSPLEMMKKRIKSSSHAKLIFGVNRKGAKMMTVVTRIVICFTIIMVCLLMGCSNQGKEVSLIATVLENNQSSLLVEPAEGSVELSSADRIVAHVGDAIINDQQGNKVYITAVAVGDQVMIIYSGEIAESYPAQIWCSQVQLMD